MAEIEDTQLQKAIFAQYIMMKKLFMELEEEREASATAASAALTMIRKLHKEKEAARMEAWQYKRIAEEKINHTDKALEILQEIMQQKELENSYLRNQLLVYKHKLLDVGIDDCDISDETITNSIPLFESKTVQDLCHSIRRNFSLPTLQLNKHSAEKDTDKNVEAVQSAKSRLGGHFSNSDENELEHVSGYAIDFKTLEVQKCLPTYMDATKKHVEEANPPSNITFQQSHPLEESSNCSSFCESSNLRDTCSERAIQVEEDAENTLHGDQLKVPHSDIKMDEVAVHPTSDNIETLKIPGRSQVAEESSCTADEIITKESECSPTAAQKERRSPALSKLSATRKVGSMNNLDRNVRVITGSSTPRAGVERTRSRLKRVQSEKMVELNSPRKNKEQIIMLKEVYEQLNMIESHMRPSTSQETPRNDQSLDSVLEAALSFSM
ncbi:hypothetical protein GUJ93_ZPchr0008g11505 [Zizania palustris]|uniref:GTD-binding domain-containing protein n=1 Tax=Zizania palustris TaxID=103762 RepID=A0A8J5RCR6_ZIZPA|nr:hypothetical protein GUJ93_ZPchr0008g11505 [Zizania palustris]KAG8047638.1 hypothetical protein GUJ93_ZPchr0008g11505 [Zizania palustris]